MLQVVGVAAVVADHVFDLRVTGAAADGFAFKLYEVGYPAYFAACAPAAVAGDKYKIERLPCIHLLQYRPPVDGLLHYIKLL